MNPFDYWFDYIRRNGRFYKKTIKDDYNLTIRDYWHYEQRWTISVYNNRLRNARAYIATYGCNGEKFIVPTDINNAHCDYILLFEKTARILEARTKDRFDIKNEIFRYLISGNKNEYKVYF